MIEQIGKEGNRQNRKHYIENGNANNFKLLWEIKPNIKTGGLVLPGTRAPDIAQGHVKNPAGGYQRFTP